MGNGTREINCRSAGNNRQILSLFPSLSLNGKWDKLAIGKNSGSHGLALSKMDHFTAFSSANAGTCATYAHL